MMGTTLEGGTLIHERGCSRLFAKFLTNTYTNKGPKPRKTVIDEDPFFDTLLAHGNSKISTHLALCHNDLGLRVICACHKGLKQ